MDQDGESIAVVDENSNLENPSPSKDKIIDESSNPCHPPPSPEIIIVQEENPDNVVEPECPELTETGELGITSVENEERIDDECDNQLNSSVEVILASDTSLEISEELPEKTTSQATPSVGASSSSKSIEDPGNILSWCESAKPRDFKVQLEMEKIWRRKVNFYCQSNDSLKSYGIVLKSQPTKFLVMCLLRAVFASEDEENVEAAINELLKIKTLYKLYNSELRQFYDTEGFLYLLDSTLAELCSEDPLVSFSSSLRFEKLSLQAQSIVFGAKIYFSLLFENFPDCVRLAKKFKSVQNVPEWQYLGCYIQRTKRLRENIPIIKPKKAEMDFLRTGLAIEPSNIPLRILSLQVLFDWMRTDDRKPRVNIYDVILGDIEDVGQFLHSELRDLLATSDLPQVYGLELYILASSFYGYRNLPGLLTKKSDSVLIPDLAKLKENNEVLKYYDIFTRDEASDQSEYYLKLALAIQPKNAPANMFRALKSLRKFLRDEAVDYLKIALNEDKFNENVILFYARILIGGNSSQQEEAFEVIEKYVNMNMIWSTFFLVHLNFLKGSLFWLMDQVKECVQAWIQGLYLDPVQFLNQFAFWSKTQIRKHLWPDKFCSYAMVDTLKKALVLLSDLAEENFEDPRTPSASAAFLTEMDFYFPSTWNMTEEISMLSKKWFYLLESHETQRHKFERASSESDGSENEPEIIELEDDEVEIVMENLGIPKNNEESIEYMDLDPSPSPAVRTTNPNVIKVNLLPGFFTAPDLIPQLDGNPMELITLE